jgi:hypothetical protein
LAPLSGGSYVGQTPVHDSNAAGSRAFWWRSSSTSCQEPDMPQTSPRHSTRTSAAAKARARSKLAARPKDAIALLKADHRQVEEWFGQFEKSRSETKKADLANRICAALTVHATIEEEIFYPAFLEATGDEDMHHEAEVEHDGAKKLIAQIQQGGPEDEYFDARVTVLSEMIKHHVKEEEQRDGMFAKAKASDMDLEALGEQMQQRKEQLEQQAGGAAPSKDEADEDEAEDQEDEDDEDEDEDDEGDDADEADEDADGTDDVGESPKPKKR